MEDRSRRHSTNVTSSILAPTRTVPVRRTRRISTRVMTASEASTFAQLPPSITVSRMDARRTIVPDRSTSSSRLPISWRLVASRPERSDPDRRCSRTSTARSSTGTSPDCKTASVTSGGDGRIGRLNFARRRSVTAGAYDSPCQRRLDVASGNRLITRAGRELRSSLGRSVPAARPCVGCRGHGVPEPHEQRDDSKGTDHRERDYQLKQRWKLEHPAIERPQHGRIVPHRRGCPSGVSIGLAIPRPSHNDILPRSASRTRSRD
jgi:hypothetical protein